MHDTLDPEFSILKQRLARRAQAEGITEADVQNMSLVDITQVRPADMPLSACVRPAMQ